MDTLGIEATPEEVDLMIDEIDQDNNGEIDFEGDSGTPIIDDVIGLLVWNHRQ